MPASKRILDETFAVLLGATGAVALAVVWNIAGLAPARPPQHGYELSQFLTPISSGFVLAYAAIAFTIGWVTARPWGCAVGMMLVLPVAALIEITRDATSHNLIPLEVLMYWIPAFTVALGLAFAGRLSRYLLSR